MEILEKIFGSATKARLMRVFVYNPELVFDTRSLVKKIRTKDVLIKKEISVLQKAGLIKKKVTKNTEGRKVKGWSLDHNFPFLPALREFLFKVSPINENTIVKKLAGAGRIKLVVIAGIFINQDGSRIDMLVVSDKPDEKNLKKNLFEIESEFGRELSFVLLSSEDFVYRLGMGDKLMRDIFDFPHKVLLNKIGLAE